jgi:hypothetical protein
MKQIIRFEVRILLVSCFFLISCKSDDNQFSQSICDFATIIDNEKYNKTITDNYNIIETSISDDCLNITLASSGCDGNTWEVELIDAGRVAETLIEQRDLKISLRNAEICLAIVEKTYSFDLKLIRTNNNKVLINLEKWNEQILYEY